MDLYDEVREKIILENFKNPHLFAGLGYKMYLSFLTSFCCHEDYFIMRKVYLKICQKVCLKDTARGRHETPLHKG